MTIDVRGILSEIQGHAARSGLFSAVLGHEPKDPPSTAGGPVACVYLRSLNPTTAFAGLNVTSVVLTATVRIHVSMLQEPQDDIDVIIVEAAEAFMQTVTGDFTLNDEATNVDLLGMAGEGMGCEFGYATIGSTMFRIADVTLPILLADQWAQAR